MDDKADKLIIITEGVFDKRLLEIVLPEEIKSKSEIIPSMGFSSAVSKAKSFSVRLSNKILLVLDSDTTSPFGTEEKKEQLDLIFRNLGKEGQVQTFLFQPELEIVFLESKELLAKIKGQMRDSYEGQISDLHKLRNQQTLIDSLSDHEIESLRTETSLKNLIELGTTLAQSA